MKKKVNLDEEFEFFTAEKLDEIVILRLKENLLFRATDLFVRDKVLDYFDHISITDSIKIVVIMSSPEVKGSEEYFDFYHRILSSRLFEKDVHRLHNVFTQIILKIVDFPAPSAPVRMVICPLGMSKETSRTASISPKDFETFLNCIIADFIIHHSF